MMSLLAGYRCYMMSMLAGYRCYVMSMLAGYRLLRDVHVIWVSSVM